jgi:hypothetical protein
MSSSYAAAYAEKFPKTIPSILTAMPENYSSAYAAMLQSEIEKGSLRGTVLDGTITSVQYREAEKDFIAIFDLGGGRTAQLEVVDTDAGVRVLDILNAKDLNSALIGK